MRRAAIFLLLCASVCADEPSRLHMFHPQPRIAPDPAGLTAADVQSVVQNAAQSVNSTAMVIAVTDRMGNFPAAVDTNELAVGLARTAAFFSNSQAPLSSRTVRFISGIHFPPGIMYTGNAPLYGIENSNRGCSFNTKFIPGQEIPPALSIDG